MLLLCLKEPAYQEFGKKPDKPKELRCYTCRKVRHWKKDCPKQNKLIAIKKDQLDSDQKQLKNDYRDLADKYSD